VKVLSIGCHPGAEVEEVSVDLVLWRADTITTLITEDRAPVTIIETDESMEVSCPERL
jgi:hypothetical protein